jgi:hypothetical protein
LEFRAELGWLETDLSWCRRHARVDRANAPLRVLTQMAAVFLLRSVDKKDGVFKLDRYYQAEV